MCNCALLVLAIVALALACYYFIVTAPVVDDDDNPFDHF